jgi:hypothetical protein
MGSRLDGVNGGPGGDRHQKARRAAALGVARPSGAPAGSICAALREALKAATVLFEGDDPRFFRT